MVSSSTHCLPTRRTISDPIHSSLFRPVAHFRDWFQLKGFDSLVCPLSFLPNARAVPHRRLVHLEDISPSSPEFAFHAPRRAQPPRSLVHLYPRHLRLLLNFLLPHSSDVEGKTCYRSTSTKSKNRSPALLAHNISDVVCPQDTLIIGYGGDRYCPSDSFSPHSLRGECCHPFLVSLAFRRHRRQRLLSHHFLFFFCHPGLLLRGTRLLRTG
ncbi:uncharacterized protein EV420DRAFT_424698 [Desarmillaria tabescens]|uniref:Uncharacterized protein n=1 Tax=Armillaria tabescens TaxID=1929756 RepID=A0AA39NLB7_ARMTA|nr:uncharacterized protein EV420DRAFT_424698 [Desarmillaria tabescens]KAK0467690.1 hypothetical protein EV420DRAFT_424698 [Desarmillaria tabescens]